MRRRTFDRQGTLLWSLATSGVLLAATLHATREPSRTEIGWQLLNHLRRHDAAGVASMFPAIELEAIGITRQQATQIVSEIVMPAANVMANNVSGVTVSGHYIVFEKPKIDLRYYHPPKILIDEPEIGKPTLSLTSLLVSYWGFERVDSLTGHSEPDYKARRKVQMARVKELGMTKSMNWILHEAEPLP